MNTFKPSVILKSLLLSYIVTALLLLLLTFLLFQFELDEGKVSVGIVIIYLLSCFLGGFLAGKKYGNRKFLWGLVTGGIYFAVLLVLSLAVKHGVQAQPLQIFTTLLVCAGSGMLGDMVS